MPWATITQTLPRALALDADAVGGDRGLALVEEGADHLEQLVAVDRAALELEVDVDVGRDRRRGLERRDVLGRGVDDRHEVLDVGEVAQRLDAARGRAGADRHQPPRLARRTSWIRSASCGRRDRALDQREVVGAVDRRRASPPGSRRSRSRPASADSSSSKSSRRELAAVAGGELPDRELRARAARSQLPHPEERRRSGRPGRPARPCRRSGGPSWQCPQWPTAHFMLRSSET